MTFKSGKVRIFRFVHLNIYQFLEYDYFFKYKKSWEGTGGLILIKIVSPDGSLIYAWFMRDIIQLAEL